VVELIFMLPVLSGKCKCNYHKPKNTRKMKKKTKIVATISDRRCDIDFIEKLYRSGMDVVRLNTAHQTRQDTLKVIDNVRKVSERIALLLDTKGPEIRTTKTEEDIILERGQTILVKGGPDELSSKLCIRVSYQNFTNEVAVGSKILIDDGYVELEVLEKKGDSLICRANNNGTVQGRKSVNVPETSFNLPSLSEKDRDYIYFAVENDLDFIAHSFVRSKEDVFEIQRILDEKKSKIKIIAKIENQDGVDNLDEILDHVYGIMVARGDLAIEIPYEKIPGIQKNIIDKCIQRRKPVIIATQMLHSMIKEPRPTRAEVSDIANAIYSKTDAIMLSGETAYGKYPVEALQTMSRVAFEVEKSRNDWHDIPAVVLSSETSAFLTKSAVEASIRLDTGSIIADTMSGRTIRNLASYRGRKPVYAFCGNKKVMRELNLSFGVYSYFKDRPESTNEFISFAASFLLEHECMKEEEKAVVLAGNFGRNQGATFIEIGTLKNLIRY